MHSNSNEKCKPFIIQSKAEATRWYRSTALLLTYPSAIICLEGRAGMMSVGDPILHWGAASTLTALSVLDAAAAAAVASLGVGGTGDPSLEAVMADAIAELKESQLMSSSLCCCRLAPSLTSSTLCFWCCWSLRASRCCCAACNNALRSSLKSP